MNIRKALNLIKVIKRFTVNYELNGKKYSMTIEAFSKKSAEKKFVKTYPNIKHFLIK